MSQFHSAFGDISDLCTDRVKDYLYGSKLCFHYRLHCTLSGFKDVRAFYSSVFHVIVTWSFELLKFLSTYPDDDDFILYFLLMFSKVKLIVIPL
jgi:hypothetical protein